jgi:hypothetical protein
VDGVEAALSPPLTLVFKPSREGRDDGGPGEGAREEAIDGRGDDRVDMVCEEERERRATGHLDGFKRWSVLLLR